MNSDTAAPQATDVAAVPDQVGVKELGDVVLYVSDLARSLELLRAPPRVAQAADAARRSCDRVLERARPSGAASHRSRPRRGAPIPSGRRVGMDDIGLKVGDSDDELRAMLRRVESRPDLVRLVGSSDHYVTHSLYVLDPTATRSRSTSTCPASTGATTRAPSLPRIEPLRL